jgi:hypothetical protein
VTPTALHTRLQAEAVSLTRIESLDPDSADKWFPFDAFPDLTGGERWVALRFADHRALLAAVVAALTAGAASPTPQLRPGRWWRCPQCRLLGGWVDTMWPGPGAVFCAECVTSLGSRVQMVSVDVPDPVAALTPDPVAEARERFYRAARAERRANAVSESEWLRYHGLYQEAYDALLAAERAAKGGG